MFSTWCGRRRELWVKMTCRTSLSMQTQPTTGAFSMNSANVSERKRFAPGEARTHGLQIMRLTRCLLRYRGTVLGRVTIHVQIQRICVQRHASKYASAGNRTRVNCLEGSYAHHYTTDACEGPVVSLGLAKNFLANTDKRVTAVTRIRTWVTAATTQGPNH